MKTLTYLTIFTLVTTSFCSCKIHRQRQREQQEEHSLQWQQEFRQQEMRLSSFDSSRRHWAFWTDSALYYHPDSGLRAQGGFMWLSAYTHTQQQTAQLQEQLRQTTSENLRVHAKEKSSLSYKSYMQIGLAVLSGLVIVYLFYKRRRHRDN